MASRSYIPFSCQFLYDHDYYDIFMKAYEISLTKILGEINRDDFGIDRSKDKIFILAAFNHITLLRKIAPIQNVTDANRMIIKESIDKLVEKFKNLYSL